MDDRARRSIPVSLLSYASNHVLRLVATVVLARILVPEDFGLFALTSLAISLLSTFNDVGVGPALIVAKDVDRRTRATALTLMIVSSILLALLLVAISPFIADLFNEPRLDELLIVVAFSLFLSGPIWFHETTLQRELEFVKRFACKLVQTVTYIAVAITLALAGAGVWSLVIGRLASYVTYLAALLTVAPDRIAPGWDGVAARRLVGSGKGFLAQDGLEYAQQQADSYSVAGFLGATQLGFYGMAYRFGELTYMGIAEPITQVTFPAFARMRERGEDWGRAFLSVLRLVALTCLPIGVILSGAAEPFVETLFGEKWLPMIGPLAVLGVWAGLKPLEGTLGWLLNSLEQQARLARIRAFALVPLVPAVIVAADRGDITAVAWVMVAHMALLLIAVAVAVARSAGPSLRRQLAAVGPLLAGAGASWAAARTTAIALDDLAPVAALASATAAGALAYLAAASALAPRLLPQAAAQVRSLRG